MNWSMAITRNREALLRLLAVLFATVSIAPGGSVAALPRQLRCTVLRLLRPAESAARRLIVIAAHEMAIRGVTVTPRPACPAPESIPRGSGEARGPGFPLIEPLKRFSFDGPRRATGPGPRIGIPGIDDAAFISQPPASPEDPVGAERLCRRLQALRRVLDDLPGQARRLARWRMRRALASSGRIRSLRPGRPPGNRARQKYEVDEILSDCHALALHAMASPDTS